MAKITQKILLAAIGGAMLYFGISTAVSKLGDLTTPFFVGAIIVVLLGIALIYQARYN